MTRVIEELPGGVFGLEAERLIGTEEFGDVMPAFTDRARRRYDVALLLAFGPATARSAGVIEQA